VLAPVLIDTTIPVSLPTTLLSAIGCHGSVGSPPPPKIAEGKITASSIVVVWSAPLSEKVDEYALEARVVPQAKDVVKADFKEIYKGTHTTFTWTALQMKTQYEFRIRGRNGAGWVTTDEEHDQSPSVLFKYHSDFDTNGVLYWIGTNGGKQSWSNPAVSGLVKTTRSSEGGGVATDIAGRTVSASFSGNQSGSWWSIDLVRYRITPHKYTLRGYAAPGFVIRNWVLEASNDGTDWTTVKRHDYDSGLLPAAGATASWDIENVTQSYQHFRIRSTGPNSASDHRLFCSGIELYGNGVPVRYRLTKSAPGGPMTLDFPN